MEEKHKGASLEMAQTEEPGERYEINVNNCSNVNNVIVSSIETENFGETTQNCKTLEENHDQSDTQIPEFTNQTECNSSNNNDSGIIYNNQEIGIDGCHIGGSGGTLVEELQQDSIREALGLPGWSKMQKNNNNNKSSFRKKKDLRGREKVSKRKSAERCRSKPRKGVFRKRSVSKKSKTTVKKTRSSKKPIVKTIEQKEEDKIEDHLEEPSLPINDRKKLANPNVNNDNNNINNSNKRNLQKGGNLKNRSRVNNKSCYNIRKRSAKKRKYSSKKANICRVCRNKINSTNSNNNSNKKSISAKKLPKDNKRRCVPSRKSFSNKKRTLKKVKKSVLRNRNNNCRGLNSIDESDCFDKSCKKQTFKKRKLNDSCIREGNLDNHPISDDSRDLLNDGLMLPKCRSINMNRNNNNTKSNAKKKNRTPISIKKNDVKLKSRSRSRAQGMSSSISESNIESSGNKKNFQVTKENKNPIKKNRCIVKNRKDLKRMRTKKGSNIPNLVLGSSSKRRQPILSFRSPKDKRKLMSNIEKARKKSNLKTAKKRMATIKRNREVMKRKAAIKKTSRKRKTSVNKSSNNKKNIKTDKKETDISVEQYSALANNGVKNRLNLKNTSRVNNRPASKNRSTSKRRPISRKRSPIRKNSSIKKKHTKNRTLMTKKKSYTKSRPKRSPRKYTRKIKSRDKGSSKSGNEESGGGITGGLAGMFGFKKMFNSKETTIEDLANNSNNNNGRNNSLKKYKRSNKKNKISKKQKVNFKKHNSYHSVSLSDFSD